MKEFHFTRREVLRIGGLSVAAPITLATAGEDVRSASLPIGNGRSCLFVFLQGGPSHLDLWDPKPDAPREVRGEFAAIPTTVPGLQLSELLPQLSRRAEDIALIRSMTHKFNNHIAGTYIMHTGSSDQPNADREAADDDYPGPGAVVSSLRSGQSSLPASVSLPNWLSIPGPSNRMPGQYGGFLGRAHDPFLIEGDPNDKNFKPLNLSLAADVSDRRFQSRQSLLTQLDEGVRAIDRQATRTWSQMHEAAMQLLTSRSIRTALDLSKESSAARERYGRTKLGQSLLLARRLIEAGVQFVSVNEFNQTWDHHMKISQTLSSQAAVLDTGIGALLTDLAKNGLLKSTLVAVTGEFGRSPSFNADAGRDHWSRVYTSLLAGGGIRGGQTLGRSDRQGGDVADNPVRPADFLATVWAALGVDAHQTLHDRQGRPVPISRGQILSELF